MLFANVSHDKHDVTLLAPLPPPPPLLLASSTQLKMGRSGGKGDKVCPRGSSVE